MYDPIIEFSVDLENKICEPKDISSLIKPVKEDVEALENMTLHALKQKLAACKKHSVHLVEYKVESDSKQKIISVVSVY